MLRQYVQIWNLCIILMFGIIVGCSDTRNSAQEKKLVVRQEEAQPVSAADQESFRKKLAGLGVPMYKDATFVEVKKKAKGSPLIVAVYEVPVQGKDDYDKVKAFYSAGLKKALVPKGWVAGTTADNVILYRKGFEIFYTEFSQLIILPDTKKILVSSNYGR